MLIGVVCGLFTLTCLVWFRGTNMWWTVLTVALVLQPTAASTKSRAAVTPSTVLDGDLEQTATTRPIGCPGSTPWTVNRRLRAG